jgi:hypothetical protein
MAKRDRWYVLRVRAGLEALAIDGLRRRGIEVFLPSKTSHISRESNDSHILARFSLANQRQVSLVPGVLDLVGVPTPSPVPDRDVENLKAATDAGMTMKILPIVGEPVRGRISKGPLSGHHGIFLEHRGRWNLVVPLEALQCTLAVPLPSSSLSISRKHKDRT